MTDISISGCGCFSVIFRWREMKTTETVQLSRGVYSNYIAKHQLSKNGYSKSKNKNLKIDTQNQNVDFGW